MRMTLRRLTVATMVLCGLCVWGLAHSGGSHAPARIECAAGEGGTHDEAEARFRNNQSTHWRYVAVGNCSMNR